MKEIGQQGRGFGEKLRNFRSKMRSFVSDLGRRRRVSQDKIFQPEPNSYVSWEILDIKGLPQHWQYLIKTESARLREGIEEDPLRKADYAPTGDIFELHESPNRIETRVHVLQTIIDDAVLSSAANKNLPQIPIVVEKAAFELSDDRFVPAIKFVLYKYIEADGRTRNALIPFWANNKDIKDYGPARDGVFEIANRTFETIGLSRMPDHPLSSSASKTPPSPLGA